MQKLSNRKFIHLSLTAVLSFILAKIYSPWGEAFIRLRRTGVVVQLNCGVGALCFLAVCSFDAKRFSHNK